MKIAAAIDMMPAKIRLRRWSIGARVKLGHSVAFKPPRDSKITLGRNVSIRARCGFSFRYEGVPIHLSIGDNTYIQGGTGMHIGHSLTIGRDCAISWNVEILGTDYHGIHREDGITGPVSLPIIIGDRVLIGTGAKILKGVTIGSDSVVGAGAVVTKSFPPKSLIAGNPATRVRGISSWSR